MLSKPLPNTPPPPGATAEIPDTNGINAKIKANQGPEISESGMRFVLQRTTPRPIERIRPDIIVGPLNSQPLRYDTAIMYCVRTSSTAEDIVKKSRFISYMTPCLSTRDAQAVLNRLSVEHPGASHIAYAFRIKTESGIACRFSDAGEPGGTAGKPIFHHLEGRDIVNCLVAVVRYFGGIKLGAGGLTRAYGNAARQAIEMNTLTPYVEYRKIPVTIDYPQQQDLEYHLKNLGGSIESRSYCERIELIVSLPESSVGEMKKLIEAKWS